MKKIVIIGGGVSGLTAGIYARQSGFEAEIYEKHTIVGGECTGWTRKGAHIDNCIHWLTGSKEGTAACKIWKNVGMLGDGVEVHYQKQFYSVELGGQMAHLWSDLEKTRKELTGISPEDTDEINGFIDGVKAFESMEMPSEKPFELMTPLDYIKLGSSMKDVGKAMKKFSDISIKELADRFKSPLLKMLIGGYMLSSYPAFSLLVSYATISSGNGGVPMGGSLAAVMRMKKRFEELGGKVFTGTGVEKINIENGHASGITLENGDIVAADYIVPSCDTDITFGKLMDEKFMPKGMKDAYAAPEKYPLMSIFGTAFELDGKPDDDIESFLFEAEKVKIGVSEATLCSLKSYAYEPSFAPEGRCIIQSTYLQLGDDYDYWKKLYDTDKAAYETEKARICEQVQANLEKRFPQFKSKLTLLDSWTPVTFNRYCGAYKGAYMSFFGIPGVKNPHYDARIKGLDNVILAGQWLNGPGGLPTALVMGKFAIQFIERTESKKK